MIPKTTACATKDVLSLDKMAKFPAPTATPSRAIRTPKTHSPTDFPGKPAMATTTPARYGYGDKWLPVQQEATHATYQSK